MAEMYEVRLAFEVFAQTPRDAVEMFLAVIERREVDRLTFTVTKDGVNVDVVDFAYGSPQMPPAKRERHLQVCPPPDPG
jgi:hypothetical protein